MNAIGYVRVSTEGQAHDGVSLDAQQSRIAAWCSANEYQLLDVHIDAGLSGGRADNRPALQKALTEACNHKAALIVYSLSRLARSTRDAIAISDRLANAGADLVSLSERIDTTTATGKMVFRMLAVLAEFERDQVSERTTVALAHLRSRGKRISRWIPFGFDLGHDGHTLTPNAMEEEAIRVMQDLQDRGHSLRQIATILEERNIDSKTGRPWTAEAIRGILRRAA
jgi:site-specific DNA recombinase